MSHFDRERGLAELLGGISTEKLKAALSVLAGADFRLFGASGEVLMGEGEQPAGARRLPLRLELEAVGYLESAVADEASLHAAGAFLELLLRATARYRMVSDLHAEAVNADYEALRFEHAALQESEARYKALAAELEQRVQEQVKTIENAQRQLYQAEKLASIGQLAAGTAHEINNPMSFIRSNLSTGREYVNKLKQLVPLIQTGNIASVAAAWREMDLDFVLEDFSGLLAESVAGADRVARIVADLKGFSNVDGAEEGIADLNDNIRTAANVIAPRLQGRIELALDLAPLPRLLCLPGHLNQVLLNLLMNAVQAISTQGKILVRSDVADDAIRIRISDDGCGIPADVVSRIFDPFFTTREVGSGTGLGLTVCRDIVRAHGGRIEVESEEGKGSTFTVYLPLAG
jgi:signal transduction histidine kinase